jgi:hypothetical protein
LKSLEISLKFVSLGIILGKLEKSGETLKSHKERKTDDVG